MFSISLNDFLDDETDFIDDGTDDQWEIYVVRDDEVVLYVGRSAHPPLRMQQHLGMDSWGKSPDLLGRLLLSNVPGVKDVRIEFYTCDECRSFQPEWSTNNRTWRAGIAEQAAISALRPCLNVSCNVEPTPLPERFRDRKAEEEMAERMRRAVERLEEL